MSDDFHVCTAGRCRRQDRGSQSAAIVQRLDDLMARCRDGHRLTYQDLLEVRDGGSTPPPTQPIHHPV